MAQMVAGHESAPMVRRRFAATRARRTAGRLVVLAVALLVAGPSGVAEAVVGDTVRAQRVDATAEIEESPENSGQVATLLREGVPTPTPTPTATPSSTATPVLSPVQSTAPTPKSNGLALTGAEVVFEVLVTLALLVLGALGVWAIRRSDARAR